MKKGFTLSEVLITLGIIGVISALTIPSVVKDYRNKLYVAQLKRVYGQIEDAIKSVMADEHAQSFSDTTAGVASAEPDEEGNFPEGKGAYYFLNKYFKTSRTGCGVGTCLATSYKPLDGSDHPMTIRGYCIQTPNGAAVCIERNNTNGISTVFVDVNGTADPNIAGRDAFTFNIDKSTGRIADWAGPESCGKKNYEEGSAMNHIADYASGCLAKIISDGWRMTY